MIFIADRVLSGASLQPCKEKAVVIQRDRIIEIGHRKDILRRYRGHRVLQLRQAVLLPGLVNTHTHLELPLFPSLIKQRDYTTWVLNLIRMKKRLRVSDFREASQANIASLIQTGTTTVGEICTHDVSRDLIVQSGLRAVVFREIISMSPRMPRIRVRSSPSRARALVRDGLSPHSPHTVSETLLKAIQDYATQKQLPLAMHVAETHDEILLLRRKQSGLNRLYAAAGWQPDWAPRARSPVAYLDQCGVLNHRFLAVHAVHISGDDITLLQRSGAGVAHCPRSNHLMGVGTMPLKEVLSAGIPVGIGTDSLASVSTLNMWDEMRFAYKKHRGNGVTPLEIIRMATLGGARALGMDDTIGSLEPGKKADIIAVPLPFREGRDIYADLLNGTDTCIMHMVNGRILKKS